MKIRNLIFLLCALMPLLVFGQTGSITIMNKGVRGENTTDLLKRLDKDVLRQSPDLVILMIGTNDLMNTHKLLPVDQYVRQVEEIVLQLTEHHIPLLVVSPPTLDPAYIYTRHDSTRYDRPLLERMKSGRDGVRTICMQRAVAYADFYNFLEGLGLPKHNADDIILNEKNSKLTDGIHLTKKGNKLLAEFIALHLQAANLIQPKMKIVCFGDSITYGAYMKGGGTCGGNTYPAYLKAALERMIGQTIQ